MVTNILRTYILNENREPIPLNDQEFIDWCVKNNRRPEENVGRTQVGDIEVVTSFLGMDISLGKKVPPLTFETILFPECDVIGRCSTWDEAEDMHRNAVQDLKLRGRAKA